MDLPAYLQIPYSLKLLQALLGIFDLSPCDSCKPFHSLYSSHIASLQNLAENVAAQEVAALLSINAQRVNLAQEQNIIVQAPEDSKDVVAAAKRVISQNRVNALGLRDQRDMTRLIAQSALQVESTFILYALSCTSCLAAQQ